MHIQLTFGLEVLQEVSFGLSLVGSRFNFLRLLLEKAIASKFRSSSRIQRSSASIYASDLSLLLGGPRANNRDLIDRLDISVLGRLLILGFKQLDRFSRGELTDSK